MKKFILVFVLFCGILFSEYLYPSVPQVGQGAEEKSSPQAGSEIYNNPGLLTDWMNVYLSAIRAAKMPSHHFRELTYTSIAFYESLVHSDAGYRSLAGQVDGLVSLPVPSATSKICWAESGNAAIADMIRSFYQNEIITAKADSMEKATMESLRAGGFATDELEAGKEYGKSIAKAILVWCKTDLSDKENDAYTLPEGEGMWEPTPPKFRTAMRPWGGNNRTIVKGSIENTLPPKPFAFSSDPSSDFYKMVNDVYKESGLKDNGHQKIALHWDDAPDGSSLGAGGHWLCILESELSARKLPLIESASIWAEMHIAMYDASIACFKAKYTYNVMRPVTYIQKYMHKPEWQPLIVTPAHPEYPAAHATISMAAATVLAKIMGDSTKIEDHSYEYRGYKTRTFNGFTEAGMQAGMSRFYGGIHYLPSIKAGYVVGSKVARNVMKGLAFRR